MATFGEVKTAIARRLLDASNAVVSDSDVADAINQSILVRKKQRFFFNEAKADVTLTEDDDSLELPSDFFVDIGDGTLVISDEDSLFSVEKVRSEDFDWQYNATNTDRPRIWTIRAGGTAQVYPKPNQDYAAVMRYLKDYTEFMTDSSQDDISNDWTTHGRNLIQSDALARLYAEFRQDDKMAAYFTARAESEADSLASFTNSFNATGTLATESIL